MIVQISFDILQIAENGNFLATNNFKNALDLAGVGMPNWEVRALLDELRGQGKYNESNGIPKDLFKEVSTQNRSRIDFFSLYFLLFLM